MTIKVALIILISFANSLIHKAQDTFSILAFDTITREVGAAGASCVDMFNFPFYSDHFICELFPDTGAIATQASYLPGNQAAARARMRAGDLPSALLAYLYANDAQNNPHVRQYGVVRMNDTSYQRTTAHTGTNCLDYKDHIIGPNYTIHGNILLGKQVLDSMEARFLKEPGDLACKLMAAMQGAKMIGADTRCASNNSSSLFAFLKVSLPTDSFGQPSLLVSLKTHTGAQIEPIDSLQKLFSAQRSCTVSTVGIPVNKKPQPLIAPNPAQDFLTVNLRDDPTFELFIFDHTGILLKSLMCPNQCRLDVSVWKRGLYVMELRSSLGTSRRKLVLN
jgi:uncharacterized Ntn-hydrolase superfamily protein